MKTLSRLNSKESALTILVIASQFFVVNDRVIAQSIPQISIPVLSSPVIPVTTPNVVTPTLNVTTTNNIPSTSLKSSPAIPTAVTPTVNVTTILTTGGKKIPSTSLINSPTPVIPTVNVTTILTTGGKKIPSTSLINSPTPAIPTVNVTTIVTTGGKKIPSASLINSPTPVIPTVNVTFDDKGVPTAVPELKPLTFSVTGNQGNTEPSFLSVINNNGVTNERTGVGSTSITIPQPTAVNGQLVTVSTVNVVFPSSQEATGISSTATDNGSSFNLQVNFTPPVLD